jgi:RIO-like serine/threonine protein kinase
MACAPVLRAFESIPGGWLMVVMNVLGKSYRRFDVLPPAPKLYDQVMVTIRSLHQAGFVHSDIRDVNVWVNEESTLEFTFVDFDWSGQIGQV